VHLHVEVTKVSSQGHLCEIWLQVQRLHVKLRNEKALAMRLQLLGFFFGTDSRIRQRLDLIYSLAKDFADGVERDDELLFIFEILEQSDLEVSVDEQKLSEVRIHGCLLGQEGRKLGFHVEEYLRCEVSVFGIGKTDKLGF